MLVQTEEEKFSRSKLGGETVDFDTAPWRTSLPPDMTSNVDKDVALAWGDSLWFYKALYPKLSPWLIHTSS